MEMWGSRVDSRPGVFYECRPRCSPAGAATWVTGAIDASTQREQEDDIAMCRNIKTLANFEPPATDEEIRASALQFVRKLSGSNKPSRTNEAAFNRALGEVTEAAQRLIRSLTISAPPRSREQEARKAKERARVRFS
jgi:hypothetical protein